MTKSNNPNWVSSSFYIPKRVNNAFDRALIDINDEDFDLDRSDVLTMLVEQWAANPAGFIRQHHA